MHYSVSDVRSLKLSAIIHIQVGGLGRPPSSRLLMLLQGPHCSHIPQSNLAVLISAGCCGRTHAVQPAEVCV